MYWNPGLGIVGGCVCLTPNPVFLTERPEESFCGLNIPCEGFRPNLPQGMILRKVDYVEIFRTGPLAQQLFGFGVRIQCLCQLVATHIGISQCLPQTDIYREAVQCFLQVTDDLRK
jgi:hypothetical protein